MVSRAKRYDWMLLAQVAKTNDTGLDNSIVVAILKAKNGPWSAAMTVEEMFAYLGINE